MSCRSMPISQNQSPLPRFTLQSIRYKYLSNIYCTACRPGGHCKISVQMSARLSAFPEAFAITQVWTSTSDLMFNFTGLLNIRACKHVTEPAPADRFEYRVALRFCTNPRRSLCTGINTNTEQEQKTCTQHSHRNATLAASRFTVPKCELES